MGEKGGSGNTITVVPPRVRATAAPRLSLRVVGEGILQKQPLPDRGAIVIGRGPDSDMRVDDPSISRRHALVTVDGPSVRIEDLGSANGTRLGDRALEPGESVELAPGEVVDLGSVMLILQAAFAGRRVRRLLPHGYFEARVEEECERAARAGGGFAVLRVHAGEQGAGAIEDVFGEVLRAADVAAIYGPGEYELLLPDTDVDRALAQASRLEDALRERGTIASTAVSVYPRDGRTPEALLAAANQALCGEPPAEASAEPAIVVADPAMERIHRLIRRVAPGQISVLILGETGVGKEIAAEMVHELSPRAGRPFLRLNCGGFTESLLESELFGHEKGSFTGAVAQKQGLLESADGGTVFLDEVGELPASLQVKLLRVLEDRQVTRVGALRGRQIDVRFVAATNRDLEEEVARGAFREDLYYRISGISIVIPPLRERVGEIAGLARLFAAQAARQSGWGEPELTSGALAAMAAYSWPGNIRELRNIIERAVLLAGGGAIGEEHLPIEKLTSRTVPRRTRSDSLGPAGPAPEPPGSARASLRDEVDDLERRRILATLESCAGNQTRAARMLGISRGTLAARLEQFGIPRPRKR